MVEILVIPRLGQIVLVVTFIAFSWLGMQAAHEGGHVLLARLTGGEVIKVALHPLIISRTDLGQNPHPLAVVWGGPLIGSVVPLFAFSLAAIFRWPGVYLLRFFAGFCLVANGVYIGIGWLLADGADPWVMTENGSPRWLLIVFGLLATPPGLYLWHRQGRHFGLGSSNGTVSTSAALVSAALLLAIIGAELLCNSK
jgi:sterol desaturase/sphingolipid hydroxylase (fatty acid hydroxylase superfamily)